MARVNPYYQGPVSDHFDGTRFFNPGHPDTDRSPRDMLRWKLREKAALWPKSVPGRQIRPEARVHGLTIAMVGHATLLIQAAGLNILTDPLWSDRASPFRRLGPRRVTPPGIAFDDLPPIDAVLLSHNHYDHLDVDTLRRLQAAHAPILVTPLGNDRIISRAVPGMRALSGDWGDRLVLPGGAEAAIVPAHHWSARGPGDRRMALWGGFMLRTKAGLVYFAGDTGYGDGAIFRAMRADHGRPDVALLPIGAYAPRWFMADQHIDPEEAVQIMTDLEARSAIGIHWGGIQLTDEAIEEPAERLAAALQSRAIDRRHFPAARAGDRFDYAHGELTQRP